MAKVPEYHTTIEYKGDTYYVRPFIMSDKAFFLECMADFPTEYFKRDNSVLFEKRINKWLTQLNNPWGGYLRNGLTGYLKGRERKAGSEGWEAHPNNIFYKNNVPFGIAYNSIIWEGSKPVVHNNTAAIHPDFRGQKLLNIMYGQGMYWTYSDKALLVVDETRYQIPHSSVEGRQHQKDRGAKHSHSREANTVDCENDSPVMHYFFTTDDQYYDYTPGATYTVTLHEYDFTNDRYGTEYVTSGDRDRDLTGATLAWDRGL